MITPITSLVTEAAENAFNSVVILVMLWVVGISPLTGSKVLLTISLPDLYSEFKRALAKIYWIPDCENLAKVSASLPKAVLSSWYAVTKSSLVVSKFVCYF